jgi:hypothetical protein
MKFNLTKTVFLLLMCSTITFKGFGQSIPTLEMDADDLPATAAFGSSLSPMTSVLKNDAANSSNFSLNSPEINVTVSFRNQQFTGLNYGSTTAVPNGSGGFYSNFQTTGLVFGVGPLTAQDGGITASGGLPLNTYDFMGAYYVGGNGGPKDNMFTTNPRATGGQLGTGMNALPSALPNTNGAFQMFTTAQALFGSSNGIGSRVYFGDIVFRFNQPVKDPVIHFSGLGGAYRYCPPTGNINNAADYISTFFATELELVNTGLSSTRMSGNPFFDVAGNNISNLNDANPNGGSFDAGLEGGLFNNYGAATGSVKLTGTVQEVVYRVYLQSGTSSQFAWSVDRSLVINNNRQPFTGDIWYAAVSIDKPTQQISGNIFNDRDGLVDNNINQSVGVANPKTNIGGLLYANLLNAAGTTVIATVPVGGDGTFLFDNVAVGTYTVQLSTNQGVPGQPRPATALPAGWVNTGEFGSNTPGNVAGSDGTVNGLSASITVNASDIKPEVNFGIERLPESVDYTRVIPSPSIGTVMTLSPTAPFPLPALSGSDPEDQPTSGTLSGKTVVLTNLPNNATLRYDGNLVVSGTPIPSFNPNLLTITFNGPAQAFAQFNYAYVDASGRPDPTPALYRLLWSGGPLVIDLTNFTATKNNCIAGLTWKTASEVNASRFEIEVSNSTSAVYNKVGSVNATAPNGKTYQFGYPMQAGVQYYFRLKMIDKDGAFKYSDVRPLSCDGKSTGITIAPNPVIDQFVISGMENGKNTIVVFAANGQQVKTQIIPQAQGYVNIGNLASGMYSVKIISEKGNVTVGKLIKN